MRDDLDPDIVRSLIDYDPETGVLTWRERPREMFCSERIWKAWNTRRAGKIAFTAVNAHGYHVGAIFRRNYLAHRVIWLIMTGDWPTDEIDHIDHNPNNNRWANLRAVTHQENCLNQRMRSTNTSGVSGVFYDATKGKWIAHIHADGRAKNLGPFSNIADAAEARSAAEKLYGYHFNHGRKL